jgi:pimeloyl-ACP methyl ester carboxylesterase
LKQTLPLNKFPGCASRNRRAVLASVLALLTFAQFSCLSSPNRVPNLQQIFAPARGRHGKRPIIVIPGILGSELVHQKTGDLAWPAIFKTTARGLRLPMSPDLEANQDDLRPGKIIERLSFARILPEVYVYRGLLDALRLYGGYKEGNWETPANDGDKDTFYVFSYDWRRDNVESARELVRRIEALKQKLNRPDLRFNIVAHSMGGLIARYAAMYGDAGLPADGTPPSPTWAGAKHILRIVMLGVPNEGSMDAFATILRGYSLTEGLRPRLRLFSSLAREVAFSCPSVFQLLPHSHSTHFVDENLQPLSIDLYDPATWRKYSWLQAAPRDARERLASNNDDGGNSDESIDRYLAQVLHRARRFHEALDTLGKETSVAFFSFAGDCEQTLDAPVIIRDQKNNRWLTLTEPRDFRTTTGKKILRKDAIAAMYLPGDGRVTRRSVLAQDLAGDREGQLFDSGLPMAYAMFGCDLHGSLPNNKILQDNALTALVSEIVK